MTEEELIHAIEVLGLEMTQEQFEEMMDRLDTNGDGEYVLAGWGWSLGPSVCLMCRRCAPCLIGLSILSLWKASVTLTTKSIDSTPDGPRCSP